MDKVQKLNGVSNSVLCNRLITPTIFHINAVIQMSLLPRP